VQHHFSFTQSSISYCRAGLLKYIRLNIFAPLKKSRMSFIIRQGDKNDVPGMFRLIRELAEFERAPEAVVNTEKKLMEDGFGKHSIYKVFVAEDANTNDIIGMALYYIAYSTWKGRILYLDDLIVTESKRRYGIGSMLLNEVLRDAKETGVEQIRWQVLDWNTPAIEFYKKVGVDFDPEWINCKMSKEQIEVYFNSLSAVGNNN
jgi:ribosomal protein S18 acetylase RimI-like enzyme